VSKRKKKWSKEKTFEGFTCSECGWLSPNPTMDGKERSKKELLEKIEADFAAHDCSKYPRKPKAKKPKSKP